MIASSPVENLLPRLDKVKKTRPGCWLARCPAHDDRSPSLSVRQADNGSILLHCFAGCGVSEVVESVGLSLADLFPPREPGVHRSRPRAPYVGRDMLEALRLDLLAIALAGSDIAKGKTLSRADAAYLSSKALHLAGELRRAAHG